MWCGGGWAGGVARSCARSGQGDQVCGVWAGLQAQLARQGRLWSCIHPRRGATAVSPRVSSGLAKDLLLCGLHFLLLFKFCYKTEAQQLYITKPEIRAWLLYKSDHLYILGDKMPSALSIAGCYI